MESRMPKSPTAKDDPFADYRDRTLRKKEGFLLLVIPTMLLALFLVLYSLGWGRT